MKRFPVLSTNLHDILVFGENIPIFMAFCVSFVRVSPKNVGLFPKNVRHNFDFVGSFFQYVRHNFTPMR